MKLLSIMLVIAVTMPMSGNAQAPGNFISGKVEFKIKNMGFTVDGTMNVSYLLFKQPSTDPSTWMLEGSASPATIETGIGLRDKHLKRSDYFDIDKHPLIQLQSISIKPKAKNNYEGTFTLTVKGISKTVMIPFSIVNNGNSNQLEGEFTINRLRFGIGEKSSILSDEVKIKVTGSFPSAHKN
jgi:polyisoprenoid-binding protein YceI